MQTTPIRILLADDHEIVRVGLAAQLGLLGCYEFVHAWSLTTLLQAAAQPPGCDLAIVDVYMPGMGAGQGLASLCEAHPHLPLIILSGASTLPHASQWRRWPSVRAILHKSGPLDGLRAAIDLALAGAAPSPASIALPAPDVWGHLDALAALSARVARVARLAAQGLSNAQIAGELGLSEGSVKQYLKQAFRELGVMNRTQLSLLLNTTPMP
ncbi:response regulator transcription factor [Comamonas flocculans]|nr:response regulator transcription factor [Comamonas flocculans]